MSSTLKSRFATSIICTTVFFIDFRSCSLVELFKTVNIIFTDRNSFLFFHLSTPRSCNFLFHNTEVARVIKIMFLNKIIKRKKVSL